MKLMIICFLAFAISTASFATVPSKGCKTKKQSKTVKSQKKLRKVVDANPQHAGYPKADVKGNFPRKYDKHTYYI